MDLSWMTAFSDPRHHREFIRHPVSVELNGIPWAIATNGIILVAVREAKPSGFAPLEATEISTLAELLTAPGAGPPNDLAALRAWCGPPQEPTTVYDAERNDDESMQCQECMGTGRIPCECPSCGDEHEIDCEECEDGRVDRPTCKGNTLSPPSIRPGLVGPALINRDLLARVLTHLSGDTVTITASGPETPLYVDGPGWRVALMPLRMPLPEDTPEWPLAPCTPRR